MSLSVAAGVTMANRRSVTIERIGYTGVLMPAPATTIYDFGANNGDDLPYYLKKADRVVAVEANPELCAQIRARFVDAIAGGRLIVENVVITEDEHDRAVPFYLSKEHHVLGQFPRPAEDRRHEFEEVGLPAKSVAQLVAQHGTPHYVKVDLEGYDEAVLRALFLSGHRPPYISSEAHTPGPFGLLVGLGGYDAFKLLDGRSVAQQYEHREIATNNGPERYSFPMHSAGPFGDDVDGPWLTASRLLTQLAVDGLGWKDIHATTQAVADPDTRPVLKARDVASLFARHVVAPRLPSSLAHAAQRSWRRLKRG